MAKKISEMTQTDWLKADRERCISDARKELANLARLRTSMPWLYRKIYADTLRRVAIYRAGAARKSYQLAA